MTQNIEKNLHTTQVRLRAAAEAGGETGAPVLIAVSKGQGADKIEQALKAGHRVFGENRVQEAQQKWPPLKEKYPGTQLHLIGPLQTNKVKAAVGLFDVIQTLDRPKLAKALSREMQGDDRKVKLFVQVNTGEEPQKTGQPPTEVAAFLQECQTLGLEIEGLMCIPPQGEESAMHFALLKKLKERHGLEALSMGMSQDFETAASLGATYVRVGTEIFGPRS